MASMSSPDDIFETGVKILRDAYAKKSELREHELRELRDQAVRRDKTIVGTRSPRVCSCAPLDPRR